MKLIACTAIKEKTPSVMEGPLGPTVSVQCLGPRRPVPTDLAECLAVELHSMSSFARASLWRSVQSVQKLGFPELDVALKALEPELLTRAQVAPPHINPDGRDWTRLASEQLLIPFCMFLSVPMRTRSVYRPLCAHEREREREREREIYIYMLAIIWASTFSIP